MNSFTLMCDNPYTTCIMAERELNELMGEVDKLRQVKDRLLEENARLQAERDKAISTLSTHAPCSSCKFRKLYRNESPCNKCLLNKFYKNPPPCKIEWVWARIGGIGMSIFETLKKYGKSKNNAIAEAIKDFNEFKTSGYIQSERPSSGNIEVAIQALQAQAEREKGCEYCNDPDCPPLDWRYGLDHILPGYKHCPMCGRGLEESE